MKNLKITSPDKILYPKDKITKLDLINYYISVSSLMLPYVKDRLLSVIRCHDDITKECFFKKHAGNDKNVKIYQEEDEDYFYISTASQLVNQVQNGTIEFHVGGSKVKNIEKPNVMVFDLDPDKNLSLEVLRDAVRKIKSVLDALGLQSYLKTSGGKGYHIVLPLSSSKDWQSFYEFSRQVAIYAESRWPKTFTTNLKKSQRKGKIFLDYLRNNRNSTCVAPYSVRAREEATVSMPICWENLDKIMPNEITIKNHEKYLNDSWSDFFEIKQKLK